MPRIHKPAPIDFLVERKYPELPFLRFPTAMTAHKLGNMTEQEKVNRLNEILAYREELKSKPPEEINRLYEIELAEHYKEIQLEAKKEEQKRFFHQLYSVADLEHWSKTAYWSLDEAIALSFGKDPEVVNWQKVEKYSDRSPFAKAYKRMRDLALRAVNMKQLSDPVSPTKFLAWATGLELPIPDDLATRVAKRHADYSERKAGHDKQLRDVDGHDQQPSAGVGSPAWLKKRAKAAADARHNQPGSSRDKQQQIRDIWATGKYSTRDRCAEEECAALNMSYSAARKALRNTPDPTPST